MRITSRLIIALVALAIVSCAINKPTVTQLVPEPPLFMVSYPLRYAPKNDGNEIVVPFGFITDLASIPPLLWWWQAPHEGTMAPAIIHDYLYWEQSCTKDEADAVLYLAMLETGISKISAKLIYDGVRTPKGQEAWDHNKTAREGGETRFFTQDYAKQLLDSQVDPKSTLASLEAEAAARKGLFKPSLPNVKVKSVCQIALQQFNTH